METKTEDKTESLEAIVMTAEELAEQIKSKQVVIADPAKNPPQRAELVVGTDVHAIIPRTIEEAQRLAHGMLLSGVVPDSYTNGNFDTSQQIARITGGILKGLEVGLPPMTALSNIMIINNRYSIWGDSAIALVQASGQLEWMREWWEGAPMSPEWTAHCEMRRKGQKVAYHQKFSVEDAKRANLWVNPKKQPWILYPQKMLQARARSWAIRDGFADVLCGLAIAEEMKDVHNEVERIETTMLNDKDLIEAEAVEVVEKE